MGDYGPTWIKKFIISEENHFQGHRLSVYFYIPEQSNDDV